MSNSLPKHGDWVLGHLAPKKPKFSVTKTETMPKSEWREIDKLKPTSKVKVKDQNGKGACFPRGTMIRMGDGTRKPIEEIRVLDEVLTAEGNVRVVMQVMVRHEADSLYRVEMQGHRHLKMTGEHPVLTQRGYVAAVDLIRGDMVAMPRYAASGRTVLQTADYVDRRVMAIRDSRGVRSVVGRKAGILTRIALPDAIHLTEGFGRVVGLFLAEGNTDSGKVCWTFNETEQDTLAAELINLLRDELGLDPSLKVKPKNHTCVVTVYGKQWAVLFEALCSKLSGRKRPHVDLMQGPINFQAAMLSGWSDGDSAGHRDRGEKGGTGVSRALTGAMYDIATAMGLRPAVRHYPSPPLTHGVKSRQPRWDILWMAGGASDTYRCQQDDLYVWRRVDGVVREDFSGDVFNLEVYGDHSYVAEGVGVHNCNGHAAATSLERSRESVGQKHVDLSAWMPYAIMCNGIDRGSNIGEALDLLSKTGTCKDGSFPYGVINPGRITTENRKEAVNYRIDVGGMLPSFADIMTAAQLGRSGNFSLRVGGNFDNLDADGVVGYSRGPGNHAITFLPVAKKTRSGFWVIKFQNSWTTRWGLDGYGWFGERHFDEQSYAEAYDIEVAMDAEDDDTNVPGKS